jgi:hypothetical protein
MNDDDHRSAAHHITDPDYTDMPPRRVIVDLENEEEVPRERPGTPRTARVTRSASAAASVSRQSRSSRAPSAALAASKAQSYKSSRRSTRRSVEQQLSPTPARTRTHSSISASPALGRPSPPQYDYYSEEEQSVTAAPGPSRGRLYVDIEFQPLDELREYAFMEKLPYPTDKSRGRLLEDQAAWEAERPRSPNRRPPPRVAKDHDAWVESDSESYKGEEEIEFLGRTTRQTVHLVFAP